MEDVTAPPTDGELRPRVVTAIQTLLPQVLGRDIPPPAESVCLFDELGLTSATTLSLLLELEEDLDIQIDVEEIGQDDLGSLGALADFVAAHAVTEF